MLSPELFPCFGISSLGMCEYNPNAPASVYFSVGDAIAALALTLAVQQFLKPIYEFRLRILKIRFSFILVAVFIGAVCAVFAALVPNIAYLRGNTFGYPLFWEVIGALFIGLAYAVIGYFSIGNTSVSARNVEYFWAATAILLSEATDDDRSAFAKEILASKNLHKLVRIASATKLAKAHAYEIEFEKLREQGKENQGIRGVPALSPFYVFANRDKLDACWFAWQTLQILSDSDFCRVVIRRHPWDFLRSIISLLEEDIDFNSLQSFVQSVIWQALQVDDGILAKENSYRGLGNHKGFARTFFENDNISSLRPLDGLEMISLGNPSACFVSRLNMACEMMVSSEITRGTFWDRSSTHDIFGAYENIFQSIGSARSGGVVSPYLGDAGRGVNSITEKVLGGIEDCDRDLYNSLFLWDVQNDRYRPISGAANLSIQLFDSISYKFDGYADPAWLLAINTFNLFFQDIGEQPLGLSPLQQAVAVGLIERLRQNMKGFYPTLSRVLLAVVGPYKREAEEKVGTAFWLFREAVYVELKKLKELYNIDPKKVHERLPFNVVYDANEDMLLHTYFGGEQVKTYLGKLHICEIDFMFEGNLRKRD